MYFITDLIDDIRHDEKKQVIATVVIMGLVLVGFFVGLAIVDPTPVNYQ